ncbi:MAG: hypothetical protein SVX43_04850 [Cyanobacteriota bacterium]|nr:hypothetical protein [Cyanobacteriota bacterium]
MSQIRDRLQFFRQQMAAFEGSADPRRAIESGYYVEQPRKSLAESIAARIALRPSSTHLLLGSIGSGKTTQLLRACDRLNEIEDISAYYVDVSSYTDIYDIKSGFFISILGLFLSEIGNFIDPEATQKHRQIIEEIVHGNNPKTLNQQLLKQLDDDIIQLRDEISRRQPKGILSSKSIKYSPEKKLGQALVNLQNIIFTKSKKKIVFLFDGLDRINNIEGLLSFLIPDLKRISEIEIGMILVIPLVTEHTKYWDALNQSVTAVHYQPHFDIENDSEARDFFEKILKKRSVEDFIDPVAIEDLIYFSGGVLRDLINLTQAAIEESYLSNSNELLQIYVTVAAGSFGRAKILGVSNTEIETLKKIVLTNEFIPRTNEDLRLVMTQRILEYQYPKLRYAVHPTIKPLIETINTAL